jgi:hypothetical protein
MHTYDIYIYHRNEHEYMRASMKAGVYLKKKNEKNEKNEKKEMNMNACVQA